MRLGYDVMSNVTSLTDAKGQTTHFEYDDVNRLTRIADPMSGAVDYNVHASGLVSTVKNRRNVVTTYQHDDLGRLTSATPNDGSPATTIAYDDLARTVTLSNATGTLT